MPDHTNRHIDSIRISLLWGDIRTWNSRMSEEVFLEMKALPVEQWCQQWSDALGNASIEDLTAVHGMLWPE